MDIYRYIVIAIWCGAASAIRCLQPLYNPQQTLTGCITKLLEQLNDKEYVSIMNEDEILHLPAIHQVKGSLFITRTIQCQESSVFTNAYIIATRTYKQLEHGLNLTQYSFFWNPTAHFIIYVEDLENCWQQMTHLLRDFNIRNVTVITNNKKDFDIYTYRSDTGSCNRSDELVVMEQCSNIGNKSLFPILKNATLRGCQFNIVFRNIWPEVSNTKSLGVEHTAIRLFEEYAGVKFHIIPYNVKVRKWSEPDLPQGITSNQVEFTAGGYVLTLHDASKYSFMYPLMIDNMMVILRHSDYLSPWQAIFVKKPSIMWLVFGVFSLYCLLAMRLSIFTKGKKDYIRDICIILGYFLNRSFVPNIQRGITNRLIFTSLLLLVLVAPYMQQAWLSSVRARPCRAYEETEASDVYLKYTHLVREYWPRFYISDRKGGNLSQCLLEVRYNRGEKLYTLATITELLLYSENLVDSECNHLLYALKDPYISLHRTFYFRRGSIVARPFNKFLFRLVESGIVSQVFKEIVYFDKLRCKVTNEGSPNHPLTLWHIKEGFYVLVGGTLVSIIVFIYECSINKIE